MKMSCPQRSRLSCGFAYLPIVIMVALAVLMVPTVNYVTGRGISFDIRKLAKSSNCKDADDPELCVMEKTLSEKEKATTNVKEKVSLESEGSKKKVKVKDKDEDEEEDEEKDAEVELWRKQLEKSTSSHVQENIDVILQQAALESAGIGDFGEIEYTPTVSQDDAGIGGNETEKGDLGGGDGNDAKGTNIGTKCPDKNNNLVVPDGRVGIGPRGETYKCVDGVWNLCPGCPITYGPSSLIDLSEIMTGGFGEFGSVDECNSCVSSVNVCLANGGLVSEDVCQGGKVCCDFAFSEDLGPTSNLPGSTKICEEEGGYICEGENRNRKFTCVGGEYIENSDASDCRSNLAKTEQEPGFLHEGPLDHDIGEVCAGDSDCKSGICHKNKCSEYLPIELTLQRENEMSNKQIPCNDKDKSDTWGPNSCVPTSFFMVAQTAYPNMTMQDVYENHFSDLTCSGSGLKYTQGELNKLGFSSTLYELYQLPSTYREKLKQFDKLVDEDKLIIARLWVQNGEEPYGGSGHIVVFNGLTGDGDLILLDPWQEGEGEGGANIVGDEYSFGGSSSYPYSITQVLVVDPLPPQE